MPSAFSSPTKPCPTAQLLKTSWPKDPRRGERRHRVLAGELGAPGRPGTLRARCLYLPGEGLRRIYGQEICNQCQVGFGDMAPRHGTSLEACAGSLPGPVTFPRDGTLQPVGFLPEFPFGFGSRYQLLPFLLPCRLAALAKMLI